MAFQMGKILELARCAATRPAAHTCRWFHRPYRHGSRQLSLTAPLQRHEVRRERREEAPPQKNFPQLTAERDVKGLSLRTSRI